MLFAALLLGLGLFAGGLIFALRLTERTPAKGGALMLFLLLTGTASLSYAAWLLLQP